MEIEAFESVWDAIEDDPAQAARMKALSALLRAVQDEVKAWKVTKSIAAERLATTPDRIDAIRRGRISEFNLDDLLTLATRAGLNVSVSAVRQAA
jgi:predicted XRE-type DNA-binding protein